nr:branched-chain amino acid ABC transporter ATP-binding protein/permease [Sulfobacillus harzensis]
MVPQLLGQNPYYLNLALEAATWALANLGLTVILGYTGQISLGQAAFFGIGAYATAIVSLHTHSLWMGLIAGIALTAIFGLIIGLSTLKMAGHYLAMVTIGFQVLISLVLNNWIPVTGGPNGITGIVRPHFFGISMLDDKPFLYLVIVILMLVASGVHVLRRFTWGRALRGIRENELAARVMGVNAFLGKAVAFTVGAAIAGLGGGLYASAAMYISPSTFNFTQSVTFLAMTVVGGAGSAAGTILGTVVLTLLPEFLRFLQNIYLVVYALIVLVVVVLLPGGIWSTVERLWQRIVAPTLPSLKSGSTPRPNLVTAGAPVLTLEGVSKSFGGLKAVDDMNLTVLGQEAHALVGPNGSGKTTVLNLISGVYPLSSGTVMLQESRINGLPADRITARGIARTFQNIRLCKEMTALENVMLGLHRHRRATFLGNMLGSPASRREQRDFEIRAMEALNFVGLSELALRPAVSLAHGQQRLVELARALVAEPTVLLLDEPAAGLNDTETANLLAVLNRLKSQGTTILLIEHDMALVTKLADRLTVLNFGRKIAQGSVEEVLKDPLVLEAFLGQDKEEEHAEAGS